MRIPSGNITRRYVFQRQASISADAFTVKMSKNGGDAQSYTTPTVATVSGMVGTYSVLLDEFTTISAGEYMTPGYIQVSAAGMNVVEIEIEIYDLSEPWKQAVTEPVTVPDWSSTTYGSVLSWIGVRAINRHHQSSASVAVYSSAGTQIASASVAVTSASANQDQWRD